MDFNGVVFCTTVKNRAQHLKLTLPQNLKNNPRSKFVVLNYNTEDDLLQYVMSRHAAEIESGRLTLYTNFMEPKFRMAHAKNMAHRLGMWEGGKILVNLDADNLTGPLDWSRENFEDFILLNIRPDAFLWASMIKGEMPRGISGRIAVTDYAFLKAGGYNEDRFIGWGSDDKDFNLRLRALGYRGIEIDATYLTGVPHNDKMRFREYPHLAKECDDYFAVNKGTIGHPVVNDGDIGCGTVYRNDDFKTPIHLDPLPTRIFGIGMHKTATTSLHHAFETLGYDSWHWSSAHAAKSIWREMNLRGRSDVIDAHHAACDLPMPPLFRQLDAGYPGSKFVLTIRDEQKWIETVRRHFDPKFNRWRAGWNQDPFSNRVHSLLYGQPDFDADIFLARYRRHNREVIEHFRDRPGDLLVMNMDAGAGWAELCGFLNAPVPADPYPFANGSSTPARRERWCIRALHSVWAALHRR
jgi:Sulfotransferase domain/N-terminal domain of galactosyltransferase